MLRPRVIPCLLLHNGGLIKTVRFQKPKYIGDPLNAVRIFNALGEVHCLVAVNADMRRGTVGLPKGLWRMSTLNGSTSNALVGDDLTDIGGGAVFNDARVQVARIVTATLRPNQNSQGALEATPTTRVH